MAIQVLKEKVADKLSHILADSPSSPSPSLSPSSSSQQQHFSIGSSPIHPPDLDKSLHWIRRWGIHTKGNEEFSTKKVLSEPNVKVVFHNSPMINMICSVQQSKARPLSTEKSHGSQKSFSSYLFSFLPTTSFSGYRSNKRRHDVSPVRSLPARWRSKSFSIKDVPLEHVSPHEGKETLETCKVDESESYALGRNIRGPENCEGTSTSDIAVKLAPELMTDSSFISSELYDFLRSCLPNIVKGCQWALLYSTLKHGISLRTLLRKSTDLPGPCLLITGDKQGAVFGGLLECPLKPTAKRKYQGTSQTFVFTTIYGPPRLFPATGANRYYYLCLNDLLAFGGGGNFALCLDEDLLHGTSGPCETFGNLCLGHSQEFELKNVELWGFTHSSRYLT